MQVFNGILAGLRRLKTLVGGLFLVFGLLFLFPATSLAQHPGCYYYPPGQCPPPPPLPAPVIDPKPSYNGSYQVKVNNTDSYSWVQWSTGQISPASSNLWPSISFTGKAPGTYSYSAKRCIFTGQTNLCSASSPSTSVTVYAAPVISVDGVANFTENGPYVYIDSTITVSDADNHQLNRALVTITSPNFVSTQDTLLYTPINGIAGSYNSGTGVLTLTGNASAANYKQALENVRYINSSDNPSTAPRTISFVVRDTTNTSSAVDTATVNITAVNDPPNAVADTASTSEETAVTVAVLSNDSDVDSSGALVLTGITQPAQGSAAIAPNGTSVTYTPAPNFNGTDSFNYTVRDSANASSTGTVTITVSPVNDAPVAVDDAAIIIIP